MVTITKVTPQEQLARHNQVNHARPLLFPVWSTKNVLHNVKVCHKGEEVTMQNTQNIFHVGYFLLGFFLGIFGLVIAIIHAGVTSNGENSKIPASLVSSVVGWVLMLMLFLCFMGIVG